MTSPHPPATSLSLRREPRAARHALRAAALALLVAVGCATPTPSRPSHVAPGADEDAAIESSAVDARAEQAADGALAPEESSGLPDSKPPEPQVLFVKASAYNSRRGQTDSTPDIAAWGDRLRPGMKVIAVSRDLLERGLVRGQRVRIAGLPGEYVVLDRMPSRWRQKIDIYMGTDVRAALNWGVRDVEISWVPAESTALEGESGAADVAESE